MKLIIHQQFTPQIWDLFAMLQGQQNILYNIEEEFNNKIICQLQLYQKQTDKVEMHS